MRFTDDSCETVRAGMAQGYANACDVAPPAFISDLVRRVETLNSLITETNTDLTGLNDRLFGSAPRPAGSSGNTAKPHGMAAELLGGIDLLIERAAAVRDEARALNSRI